MNYYDRSFVNALIHLYPDVGFDRVQFLEGNTSRLITPLSLPSYIPPLNFLISHLDDSVPDIGELMRPSRPQVPFSYDKFATAYWFDIKTKKKEIIKFD